ncbi:amidase [Peribacillus butanolivorans]|uniref:amidase n=1 Tax=Peribacillus butanolivorans TaxID=421767 RepID=UPI00365EEA3F
MSLKYEIAYMSATDLAKKIKSRQLSPVEVVDAFIERIEERNKSLNAFIYFRYEDAKRKAKEAEEAVMKGKELGAFHGVPTALKDIFGSRPGWKETFGGIKAFKEFEAKANCIYAERMEKAGAIMMGKTNSPAMAFRGVTDNYLFGPTRNPFDLSKNSGGSSGGSAAAVADGLIPIAHGTDGGGSLRIPASWCGVFGYKASVGRIPFISRPNAFVGSTPFLFEGAITRTVDDAAMALSVLSGYHPGDPFSLNETFDFQKSLGQSVKGWRIAYSPDFDVFPVDKRVRDVVTNAIKVFEEAGAHVEEVNLGINRSHKELSDMWCRLSTPSIMEALEGFEKDGIDLLQDHPEDLPPEIHKWLKEISQMTVMDLTRDQQIRTEIYDAIQGVYQDYDLLITPTLACLPVNNAEDGNTLGPSHINGEEINNLIGWCMTYFTNFSGHPSASIPAGLAEDKYPVGMQIIGKQRADLDVLTASAVFEKMKPWHGMYDACMNRPISVQV